MKREKLRSVRVAWSLSNVYLFIYAEFFTKHCCDHTFTMGMMVHSGHILNISSLFLYALPKIQGSTEVQQC